MYRRNALLFGLSARVHFRNSAVNDHLWFLLEVDANSTGCGTR